jgi:hypothetical protein
VVGLGGSYGLEEGTARIGADAPWITRRRLLQGLSPAVAARPSPVAELRPSGWRPRGEVGDGGADLVVLLQFDSFCCPAAKAGPCLPSDKIRRLRTFDPTAGDPGAGKSDPRGKPSTFHYQSVFLKVLWNVDSTDTIYIHTDIPIMSQI